MNYENIPTVKESRLTSLALMLINVNNRGLKDLREFRRYLFFSARKKRVLTSIKPATIVMM